MRVQTFRAFLFPRVAMICPFIAEQGMSASFSLSIRNHTAAALNLENSISSLQCAGQLLLGCAVSEHPAAALPKQGLM